MSAHRGKHLADCRTAFAVDHAAARWIADGSLTIAQHCQTVNAHFLGLDDTELPDPDF